MVPGFLGSQKMTVGGLRFPPDTREGESWVMGYERLQFGQSQRGADTCYRVPGPGPSPGSGATTEVLFLGGKNGAMRGQSALYWDTEDYSLPDPEGIAWEGACPAAPTERNILGQPVLSLLCHSSIMQEGGLPGLTTLPFVGGCPRSSLRSSLGQTCPSGCPPSPQSCLSG